MSCLTYHPLRLLLAVRCHVFLPGGLPVTGSSLPALTSQPAATEQGPQLNLSWTDHPNQPASTAWAHQLLLQLLVCLHQQGCSWHLPSAAAAGNF
jgi:hypothetical protein